MNIIRAVTIIPYNHRTLFGFEKLVLQFQHFEELLGNCVKPFSLFGKIEKIIDV